MPDTTGFLEVQYPTILEDTDVPKYLEIGGAGIPDVRGYWGGEIPEHPTFFNTGFEGFDTPAYRIQTACPGFRVF